MVNTVYEYNQRETDGFSLRDWTSTYYGGLETMFANYPDYFEFIEIDMNEKMEVVSWNRYGSVDYADVILACNSENYLWSMPYSNDIVIEHSDNIKQYIEQNLSLIDPSGLDEELEPILGIVDQENSEKKRFRVPTTNSIVAVVNLIETYRKTNTEQEWDLDE